MKFSVLNRKVHYWLSLVIAVPLLVVIVTGILLQLKKELPWVQPPHNRGSSKELAISFDQILAAARSVPEAEIKGWSDIDRLDVRPGHGMLKVQAKNAWEIQLDAKTGKVLQVAYRRSDFIESLHDGSWFSDLVKSWVFLPSAIILLVLWLTGMYLFWLPIVVKNRRKRQTVTASAVLSTVPIPSNRANQPN
jgi:uncharacterized iron-regulated membrane protein